MSQSERKAKISSTHELPVTQQCQLLSLSRSSAYYQAKALSDEESRLMRYMDALHLRYPFYGARRLRDALLDEHGNCQGTCRLGELTHAALSIVI